MNNNYQSNSTSSFSKFQYIDLQVGLANINKSFSTDNGRNLSNYTSLYTSSVQSPSPLLWSPPAQSNLLAALVIHYYILFIIG